MFAGTVKFTLLVVVFLIVEPLISTDCYIFDLCVNVTVRISYGPFLEEFKFTDVLIILSNRQ